MARYSPSKKEFESLRAQYSVVPVWREVLADFETPVSAYLKLAGEGASFLLESVEHGERWGRYSFLGFDPFLVVQGDAKNDGPAGRGANPLEELRAALDHHRAPKLPGLPPFFGGAVGYIGYDCVRYLEDLPQSTDDDVGAAELLFMFPRTVLAFDHLRQKITAVSNVLTGDTYDEAVARTDALVQKLGRPLAYSPIDLGRPEVQEPSSTMTREDFQKAVLKAKEHIAAGDIFQVVLSHRFSIDLDVDPFSVYRGLRVVNPSPYMFFLSHPEITLIGSSPEPLVTVQGRRVVQRPIAGTRPRGETPEQDARLEEELLADEKERAEHVMLVDLARNDLGRVSHWGSVRVEELMTVERYSHVMHLVSQVSGELAEGKSGVDALFSSFPAGTVSGAPKIRAMEIIDELEPTRRGPYAGVVGYIDFSGDLDTCITLRTAYVTGGKLHVQAGAGIVADSDPATEWDETVNKARALLMAAEIARGIR